MLTILYSEGDYTAADIAIRVQALAQGQGQQLYVSPKHFGRNEESVKKALSKSKNALFIAFDKTTIDDKTLQEIKYLQSIPCKIYAIVPMEMTLPNIPMDVYKFQSKNFSNFVEVVQNFIKHLSENNSKSPKNNQLLIGTGILILSILLLSLFDNEKK
ncbi:MAG: hypothetical protein OHK0038_20430 [Flammeovirgaceae bacterium]